MAEQQKVDEKWDKIALMLDEYQNKLGLNIQPSNKITEILNLTYDQLCKIPTEDCKIYAFLLQQYALYLQKEINRHQSKQIWARHNLDVMAGKFAQTYGSQYTSYEERKLMMVNDNSYASALHSIIKLTSVTIEDLSYIGRKIDSMANILGKIRQENTNEKQHSSPTG